MHLALPRVDCRECESALFFLVVAAIILGTSAWQAWPSAVREESKEAEV